MIGSKYPYFKTKINMAKKKPNIPEGKQPLDGCDFCMQFDYDEPHVIGASADGDGGRCDQPDACLVLRGGDHAGQLRCVGRLGAQAWAARQPVCGSGQHLSVRRRGEYCRATGGKAAADAVWAGDGAVGHQTHPRQQPPGQGSRGTDERNAARPAGQRDAAGRDQ